MSNKASLIVLAAGMGSRYGGLKQMDHLSPLALQVQHGQYPRAFL